MDWKIPNDKTDAVITAQKHIASSHGNSSVPQLPETCIIFEIGMAIPFIEEHFSTYTITQHIPGFITDQKCIGVEPPRKGCFFVGKGKRTLTNLNGTVRRSSVVQGSPYKINCGGNGRKDFNYYYATLAIFELIRYNKQEYMLDPGRLPS